jgi:hypothetical protein
MIGHPKCRAILVCVVALSAAMGASAITGRGEAAATDSALFARYAVSKLYHGPIRLPDFRHRDRAFSDFRTAIRKGMREGVNFAGHYAIVSWGCGTECIAYVIGDVATGRVFEFPLGGEYRELSLDTRPTSRLIVAEWIPDSDGQSGDGAAVVNWCRQDFVWNGSSAVPLSKPAVEATIRYPGLEACNDQ